MRHLLTIAAIMTICGAAEAQNDPVIMTVNGKPVTRSEFEYSYNKNNSENVVDKKSIEDYVDLFINYKLKVEAALDAKLDTLTSYQNEFRQYRDQQIRPAFINDASIEAEAHKIYNDTKRNIGEKGLIHPAHIFLRVTQQAPQDEEERVKARADSVYTALKNGADFAETAKKISQDPGSAAKGGDLPWITPGQSLKEFEKAAYDLQPGEISQPVLSPAGYHIILMKERKQLEPYDSLRESIISFIDKRGLREHIIDQNIDSVAKTMHITKKELMDKKTEEMAKDDSDLSYLVQEYHDGLLLYEISNRTVWDKAAKDEEGQKKFFKKNKKKYRWKEPRFKGIAYHTQTLGAVDSVKQCVKKINFSQWAPVLRKTFNNDSVIRIRVEKGIFKRGDNALVDRNIFGVDTAHVKPVKKYPYDATYGKVLKKGPEDYTDVKGLVTADYQEAMEKEWVAQLRKKYPFTVNRDVLATVNNH